MLDRLFLLPYYLVLAARHFMYNHNFILKSKEAEVPTICLGNITAGGTGKTPHTEMILRLLQRSDEWAYRDVAVLSRGYKRKSKGFQQVVTDGTATLYGDEPLQMKKKFPAVTVAVDKDRIEGCRFLCHPELLQTSRKARKCRHKELSPAELIVLDDAFQFRKLKATYNILLVDWNRPVSKDRLIPFGRLRDLPSRMRAADAIIITKCPYYMEEGDREKFLAGLGYKSYNSETCEAVNRRGRVQRLFFSCIKYQPLKAVFEEGENRYIYSKNIVLFSGIAKDTPLRMYLSDNYKIVKSLAFEDHHRYRPSDFRKIISAFKAHPTTAVATTEKDAQRVLDCRKIPDRLKERLFQVPIEMEFLSEREEALFEESLLAAVRRRARDLR